MSRSFIQNLLQQHWATRTPRDRKIMTALIIVIAVVLYAVLITSLSRARGPLRAQVATLRTQSTQLDQQVIEYTQVQTAPPVNASTSELKTLVQAQANKAGLASALGRIDALDTNQVVVVFGAVAFNTWLHWIADLQAQHVRLSVCRIETLSTTGLVSVTATLVRPKSINGANKT